jgi:DNA-binding SARP family transcriptional activator
MGGYGSAAAGQIGVEPVDLVLEVAAHGLTAVLATWLGLLVVSRARHSPGAPVFALLSLLLVIWSLAIIGQRLGSNEEMHPILNVFENFASFLLPAAVAHLGISVALEGRRSRAAAIVLGAAYAIGLLAWLQSAVDPAHPILPAPPHFEPLGISGALLGWGFILARAAIFAAGIGWLVAALRRAGDDVSRQRQIKVTLLTLGLGIVGGMARILPEGVGGPRWVGISLIAAASVLAVYAVLAQRLFSGTRLTMRAFRGSLVIGLAVVVYVAFLVALDRAVAELIGLELPLVIALSMVVTIALFDPITDSVRRFLAGDDEEDQGYARLLRAMGEDAFSARADDDLLATALARLVRVFDLTGAAVLNGAGQTTLVVGDLDPAEDPHVRVQLGTTGSHLAFGPKRSGLPLRPDELDLLRLATSYLDAALQHGQRQDVQATALVELSREGQTVQRREAVLTEAMAVHRTPTKGLHVYALGPLRAERDGEPVRQWGGAKAGSRQAEAIFAFLFDRGERGAAKDEIIETIWPDVELERADTAFHRTMLGLRSMLAPGRDRRAEGPITFGNDRYRLAPDVVTWSDVAEFERLLNATRTAESIEDRVRLLEAARALYRSDLLDDCPFYGDSVHVEERREELRERVADLLIELSDRYAEDGDRAAAADALRRAQTISGRDLSGAMEALPAVGVH